MFKDPFSHTINNPTSPAEICFAIVPDDNADIQMATKALYVGQGGNLRLVSVRNENAISFMNVPSGAILDVRVRQVLATGTTASDIVGLA